MPDFDPKKYPAVSGVYLMYDASSTILYVGKARNLRARLRTYFSVQGDGRNHIRFLMRRVERIETIVTDTEKEALILENTLIKKHRPRYNIHLRDDKTHISIRIDPHEDFPLLRVVRKAEKDGALYFGPYSSTSAVRSTLKEIYRIFPLRHHPVSTCQRRGRPCLFHQIGQCSAPCFDKISVSEYKKLVDGVIALLKGRESEVLLLLQKKMEKASELMHFEEAAHLRDQIKGIKKTVEKQKVVSNTTENQDVFGVFRQSGHLDIALLHIRQGKLLGKNLFSLPWDRPESEIMTALIQQYYDKGQLIPEEVLTAIELDDAQVLADWLSDSKGKKVHLGIPQRGDKKALVDMASLNAQQAAENRQKREADNTTMLQEIAGRLQLPALPKRIECYDISNFQGKDSVGSMVVLINGEAAKEEYRHYRIRTVVGSDDFASLHEVLSRRLQRGVEENNLPDLILLDGGKGQLSAVEGLLREYCVECQVQIASIAKSRVQRNVRGKMVERSEERFFRPGRQNPITFRNGSAALFALVRLRDEAHRFAITHHRKLRDKSTLKSRLEEVQGIGPSRRKFLLKQYGSIKKIESLSLEELFKTEGIPATILQTLYNYLHSDE